MYLTFSVMFDLLCFCKQFFGTLKPELLENSFQGEGFLEIGLYVLPWFVHVSLLKQQQINDGQNQNSASLRLSRLNFYTSLDCPDICPSTLPLHRGRKASGSFFLLLINVVRLTSTDSLPMWLHVEEIILK